MANRSTNHHGFWQNYADNVILKPSLPGVITTSCGSQHAPAARNCKWSPGTASGASMRAALIMVFFLIFGFTRATDAAEINCARGEAVHADLGDGVIMRTCMWRNAANITVRTGQLELIKNGVPILKLETDLNGKLHGPYTAWNDAGEVTENGNYVEGLKDGPWTTTHKNGTRKTLHYRAGNIVDP
jgi:hypothetical protein